MNTWTPPRGSRVVVIEPHADDAYLSLGSTLERLIEHGVSVDVVTVFGTPKRNVEAANWCAAIGADHYALGYPESGCGLSGPEPSSFPVTPSGLCMEVDRIAPDHARTIWPLGLQHPEHRMVAAAGRRWRAMAYVETPYQLTRKNGPELESRSEGRAVLQDAPRDPRWERHIPIFRSQSFYFYRNASRARRCHEVILGGDYG